MQHIDINEIKSWDRFYRGNFINSLSGFKSVSLIGTINTEGITNLGLFSNIVHLGADPALIGFINRPIAAAPHTVNNIEATKSYTINHIHRNIVAQAHGTSAKYADGESEFDAVGLTPIFKEGVKAPFVKESLIQYALELVEIVPIKHNQTFLVIGAINHVFIDKDFISKDGFIAIEKAGSITSLGLDGYYDTTHIARYHYAKPFEPVIKIDE
ncbi:flavin reductase family protein [Ferruginibacter yonginensis]|uniref:Flavin reductase family protein n=1 Tax=Ferruginibacter yonginensis TaxID=1310416 RepID=A0ABV8QPU4_9BACT